MGRELLKNKYFWITLAIIIPLLTSLYLRTYPARLTITKDWARSSVESNIKNSIIEQINKQYPYLPQAQKEELVNKQLKEVEQQYRQEINEQINQLASYYKSRFQLEYDKNRSTTYLLAIDPYTYYRYTRNYLDHGHAGDIKINNTWYDALMLAPFGIPRAETPFHVYIEAYWYKLLTIFDKDIHLMHSTFYVPVVLSLLAVIPAFFIGKKLEKKRDAAILAGFIAAFLIAIHPAFLRILTY